MIVSLMETHQDDGTNCQFECVAKMHPEALGGNTVQFVAIIRSDILGPPRFRPGLNWKTYHEKNHVSLKSDLSNSNKKNGTN